MTENTSQAEAIAILKKIVTDLTTAQVDLKSVLRRCQHVCEILGWVSRKDWFHQELNGYYEGTPLPDYRQIPGTVGWHPGRDRYEKMSWETEELIYGKVEESIYEYAPDALEVRAGIDWLIFYRSSGYTEILGETKEVKSPSGKKVMILQKRREFSALNINYAVTQIEKIAFDFASMSYAQLRYGDTVGSIWSIFRREVDEKMTSLNLSQHTKSIERGLISDNPEDWRSAVYGCRSLLNDLANLLWKDGKPRYDLLPGKTKEGTLDVSQGKFGNRLAAYLHQKEITGTRGSFLRGELDRLAGSIQSLIPLQSEAHEPISFQDAQSIALKTYIAVGEIVRRTDLEVITEY